MSATKEEILNEYLKSPDSDIRSMADLDALIQKHIAAYAGSHLIFKFIGVNGYFDLRYDITPADISAKGRAGEIESFRRFAYGLVWLGAFRDRFSLGDATPTLRQRALEIREWRWRIRYWESV